MVLPLLVLGFSFPLHLSAAETQAAAPAAAINTGDNAWMLVSAALVLMMTAPGLVLFYGGLVRNRSVLSTMMHSFILMSVISILWMIFGYSMAFGDGNAFVGNPLQYFMLHGVGAAPRADYAPTVPQETFMLFQMMFSILPEGPSSTSAPASRRSCAPSSWASGRDSRTSRCFRTTWC